MSDNGSQLSSRTCCMLSSGLSTTCDGQDKVFKPARKGTFWGGRPPCVVVVGGKILLQLIA